MGAFVGVTVGVCVDVGVGVVVGVTVGVSVGVEVGVRVGVGVEVGVGVDVVVDVGVGTSNGTDWPQMPSLLAEISWLSPAVLSAKSRICWPDAESTNCQLRPASSVRKIWLPSSAAKAVSPTRSSTNSTLTKPCAVGSAVALGMAEAVV